MMQHYDLTTITEEPVPVKVIIIHSRYRPKPGRVLDADQDQRDQLTTRLSLRREK